MGLSTMGSMVDLVVAVTAPIHAQRLDLAEIRPFLTKPLDRGLLSPFDHRCHLLEALGRGRVANLGEPFQVDFCYCSIDPGFD